MTPISTDRPAVAFGRAREGAFSGPPPTSVTGLTKTKPGEFSLNPDCGALRLALQPEHPAGQGREPHLP